jgi:hypothetical protein
VAEFRTNVNGTTNPKKRRMSYRKNYCTPGIEKALNIAGIPSVYE